MILSFYKNLYSTNKILSPSHPVRPVTIGESVRHEPTQYEIMTPIQYETS